MPPTRHILRPSAERLETHVLLSTVAIAPAMEASGSPIVETLTTDKSVYKVGQPIHITLTETNTTNSEIVSPNIKQNGSFTASRDFTYVWKSKARRTDATSFTLQPGQTHTVTVTWNGHANVASSSRSTPLTGTFQIDNTLANNTVSIAIDPAHGKGSKAGVTAAVANEILTLTG